MLWNWKQSRARNARVEPLKEGERDVHGHRCQEPNGARLEKRWRVLPRPDERVECGERLWGERLDDDEV